MTRRVARPIHDQSAGARRLAARSALTLLAVVTTLALASAAALAQTATQNRPPFASGTLESVSGSTLQVNGFNGNTSVVVTKTTKYASTKSADASAIAVKECARAIGTGSDTSGIQAATITLTQATSKGCVTDQAAGTGGPFGNGTRRGANGNGGTNGSATNSTPPRTSPSGGTRPTNFGTAAGVVTKVAGDQVTIKATVTVASTKQGAKPKTKTENVVVTVSDSTRVTQTLPVTLSDLTTGSCVTATGSADSVGTITATNVTMSQPVNGSCRGFGGFGGFGGFRGNGGQNSGGQNSGSASNTA
jgi:hypothetical protein